MKSPREIEIKLKVEHPFTLRKKLKQCGFVVLERQHFERNIVFDFPDSRLRRSCSLLRLRTAGKRHILTYKGPPQASDAYKIRTEIETEVHDAGPLRGILEALGFRPIFRYEKFRTAYAEKDRTHVLEAQLVYDETPIGNYVELEGPARWIDRVARRLGYEKRDYVTASYAALYQDYCRENGVQQGDMVFSEINS